MKLFLLCVNCLLVNFLFAQQKKLFSSLPAKQTGIFFNNRLVENAENNIITYEYFYNGGGVAAGDFNNDGLIDIYFTANQQPNKLYLNKGNFKFVDITKSAGVGGRTGWKTGVSVADVNGDGWLDIYVCYSGDVDLSRRANQLFINNGNLTFTDKAKEWGVADQGYTTHAAFFDYDRDGDLDLYVMNHNIKNLRNFDAAFVKKMVDPDAGDRFYENINGKFVDVSRKAGIISNPLGYGLGLSIADVNNDGWPDIYVSNDYVEEDYLYLNNKDGSFTESLKSTFGHISNFSMGVDIADINNDELVDVFTLDMLPEDNRRQKLLYMPDNYELYNNTLQNGFYHQLMRNMLQVNNGDGTFSEVGQVAGMSNTDWSWAALLTDFDNDGKKDLFVTNGYGRDMINRDFMKFYANERLKHLRGQTDSRMFQMLQGIQSTPLHNYLFLNKGNFQFADSSLSSGFEELNFSHGAAYADLDNDGDLDLIVSKMNQEAGIYKNNTIENKQNGNFLRLLLKTNTKNKYAVGAKVSAFTLSGVYTIENYPVHGFQSSMQIPMHFTFPDKLVDSLQIRWPNGEMQTVIRDITINKQITIEKAKSSDDNVMSVAANKTIFKPSGIKINYVHKEDVTNDFKIQPLMPNMLSYSGPRITKADVNGDRLDDIYICGPKYQAGVLFLQQQNGEFTRSIQLEFEKDAPAEDCGAVFFDADGDGDMDLYVVSGGFPIGDDETFLQDRLYFNEGGNFVRKNDLLPEEKESGSHVVAMDFDNDGDEDLFIAGRVIPGQYPKTPQSHLLINTGKGKFKNETVLLAPQFLELGMVTDAKWADIDGDKNNELIVCGEWMTLKCFSFNGQQFEETSEKIFNDKLSGWWNRIELADLDKDGDLDLIAGNWGTNSQIKVNVKQPAVMYYGDFDNNGYVDPLLCYFVQGTSYPMASRDEITDQIVSLRQRFPTYDAYADATINDILSEEQLQQAKQLSANYFYTTWFENVNGKFVTRKFPVQVNFSPVHAICAEDFNGDGNIDILLGGNIEQVRIKIGKIDASYGTLLLGNGKGDFNYVSQLKSGLSVKGCVREIIRLNSKAGDKKLVFGLNNLAPVFMAY